MLDGGTKLMFDRIYKMGTGGLPTYLGSVAPFVG